MPGPIARRSFLQQAAAGFAALHAPGVVRVAVAAVPAQPQRILVIGAGMAGLSAALDLVERGHDVTVLEARTRPGGRVHTLRDPFPDGLYADAGAMQVYDSHLRAQRRIRELGLELDPIRPAAPRSVLHVLGTRIEMDPGEPVDWPFPMHENERGLDSRGLWVRYVEPLLTPIREADERGTLLDSFGQYDRVTFSQFLREQGASPGAVAILAAGLAAGLGDGADYHSALNLLREAAYRQLRRGAFTIPGGTDRLPQGMAAHLGERIRYGKPVSRIEQDENGVRAIAGRGSTARSFEADRLVVAVPFAVLRDIEIHPALPSATRAAVDGLRNTSVVKVFVQTRTRFWIAEGHSGLASTDLPVNFVSERSINQPGTRGLLEAYVAGANARSLCRLDERERVAHITRELAKVFPRISDEQEGGTSVCWDDDEWARGAYAWFAPGDMTNLLPHIARQHSRIHFAGDHTSPTPGWMEGALQSAERVVSEIESTGTG